MLPIYFSLEKWNCWFRDQAAFSSHGPRDTAATAPPSPPHHLCHRHISPCMLLIQMTGQHIYIYMHMYIQMYIYVCIYTLSSSLCFHFFSGKNADSISKASFQPPVFLPQQMGICVRGRGTALQLSIGWNKHHSRLFPQDSFQLLVFSHIVL